MEPTPAQASDAPHRGADSLAVVRYRWWLVALTTLFGIAAAGAWAETRDPVWESTTSVLVNPVGRDINVVGGRTQGQVNLDTEAQLVRSTAVAAGAAERLPPAPPEDLARRVRVEVPPNTSVLMITFSGRSPAEAQTGSRAFAEAYLRHREQTERAELAAQASAIEEKIAELNASLTEINERLAGTASASAAAANLESQRTTVTNQLTTMTTRLDELGTATVTAGAVISEARLPQHPSRPQPAIILGSGAAVGLVLGVVLAGLADRLARRVHRPVDVARRFGVPVLAALTPATAPHRDDLAVPYSRGGRAFDRLRNEVIAMSASLGGPRDAGPRDAGPRSGGGPGGGTPGGRVIMVTGASTGDAASLVAATLAASLSRSGQDVVLVGARPSQEPASPLVRLLGVAPAPGLSDVLTGRMPLADALQRAPRQPQLQVIATGGTSSATGVVQSPALPATISALAGQASYVVIDAPPACSSADAQSLASHADAALLVVVAGRTRLAEVADAADQLHRVGTPLLGAVVVPALRRDRRRGTSRRAHPEPAPASRLEPAPPAPQSQRVQPPLQSQPVPWHQPPGAARVGPANGRHTSLRPYPSAAGAGAPGPAGSEAESADPDAQTVLLPRIRGEVAGGEPAATDAPGGGPPIWSPGHPDGAG